MKHIFSPLVFVFFCSVILLLTLRGIPGNPTYQTLNNPEWKDEGPLELSPERGRFALLYSMVEDNSLYFSLPVARFATPDLGYKDGRYVSLFAPGVSFLAIPGYLIGKTVSVSQVGTFGVIALFAICNALLIRAIAITLGARILPATIAAALFLFATPAFSYAVSLYQHHISTFTLLLALFALIRWNTLWSLALIWFLGATSLLIDYPNLFFLAPVGIAAFAKLIFFEKRQTGVAIHVRLWRAATLATVIVPLLFFFWFNQASYGNPFQLSGTTGGVKAIDQSGQPAVGQETHRENQASLLDPAKQKKNTITFFQTRNLLNGFYTQFVSPDRGMLWYTPIVFLGIWGGVLLYRKNNPWLSVLVGIIGTNVLLYAMWGDPWGGWAFGARYLIPSYAISAILIAIAIQSLKKSVAFYLLFFILVGYSVAVNTLGALTTNRNPPQVEVLSLEKLSGIEEKYTYQRNYDMITSGRSKSFVFQTFASRYVTAEQYYLFVTGSIIIVLFGISSYYKFQRE